MKNLKKNRLKQIMDNDYSKTIIFYTKRNNINYWII